MKYIFILFILISNFSVSQTLIDSLTLQEINNYRKSKGIKSLEFDNIAFKAANHHCKYLKDSTDFLTHHESVLVNPQDRLKFYGGKYNHIGENLTLVSKNFPETQDIEGISKEIAKSVFESWRDSPTHNKIMLESDFKFASVSTLIIISDAGFGNYKNYLVYSTFVTYTYY